MAKESPFVDIALDVARSIRVPPLSIERAAPLLYQFTADIHLRLTTDPRARRKRACYATKRLFDSYF